MAPVLSRAVRVALSFPNKRNPAAHTEMGFPSHTFCASAVVKEAIYQHVQRLSFACRFRLLHWAVPAIWGMREGERSEILELYLTRMGHDVNSFYL